MLYALYRMGYHGRATVPGFRAMASTALNEMGFRPDVIERQLAHQEQNAVRAAVVTEARIEIVRQPSPNFITQQFARSLSRQGQGLVQ